MPPLWSRRDWEAALLFSGQNVLGAVMAEGVQQRGSLVWQEEQGARLRELGWSSSSAVQSWGNGSVTQFPHL